MAVSTTASAQPVAAAPAGRRPLCASRSGPFALTLPALLLLTLLFVLPLGRLFALSFEGGEPRLVREGADRRALHHDPLPDLRDRRHRHALLPRDRLSGGVPARDHDAGLARHRLRLRHAAAVDQRAGAHLCLDGAAGAQRHHQPHPDRLRPARRAAADAQQQDGGDPRHGARHAAVHDPADLQRRDAHRSGPAEGGARPRRVRRCAS